MLYLGNKLALSSSSQEIFPFILGEVKLLLLLPPTLWLLIWLWLLLLLCSRVHPDDVLTQFVLALELFPAIVAHKLAEVRVP